MKKYIRYFFSILFLAIIFTYKSFAQSAEDLENIWSIVKIQPNVLQEAKTDNGWVPAEQVSKIIGETDEIIVGLNFRPKPTTNTTQSEVSVDVHPSNQNIVFGSANATDWPVTQVYGTGVYWSLNGGTTWTGFDQPPFGSNRGDPVSVIGTDGRFYENYISSSSGQGVAVSTNNGVNWTTHTVAPNPGTLADKNHYMVDKKTGSPYENRSYCAWTDFGGTNNYDAVVRYSSNYGVTWSSSINLSNALSSYLNQGVNIQTGPNGEVYATWAVYIDASVSTGEDGIGFSKSTDGGVTWSAPTYAYQATNFGLRGTLSSKSGIRVSSFPSMSVDRSGGPYNGTIYITWPQDDVAPAGSDPDIVFIKSTNGGTSWTTPVRINNDAINNGKDQYYSWGTVDQSTGQYMIVFYDSRNVPNNQAEVYMARSMDGGATFENFLVSDQVHTPAPISGLASGYAGDYIGVASLDDVAYPFWGDNRTGIYQGWMAKVTYGPPCPIALPSNPNPLSGATSVSVNIPQISWNNGAGAAQCEVWFGAGTMTKVYDGVTISSWSIPAPLAYNTSYNWQIVNKNDTCGVAGSIWTFTTELSPDIVFMESFNNLNCWTSIGPLGVANWSTQSTNNAGGTAPELRLSWTPQFDGLSKLVSCALLVQNNHDYSIDLSHMLDWYATPSPTLGLGISYDNGATYTPIWSITPTGNVGPENLNIQFTTPAGDSPETINLYLVLFCNGNSYNIDYWYIDNIVVHDEEYFSVTDPGSVTATPVSGSQINVSFTPNLNNNNVVVVWNLSGTFSVPSGTPPAVGQPFAGGTLLYNGTTSPVNHTGLNQLTTYYYKLFSYNGTNYSTGVNTNATTSYSTDFSVNLLISDNCTNSVSLIFGTGPSATDCFDLGMDVSAPPPPPPGAFDGRFVSCNEGLFTDYKGSNPSGERIWDVHFQPAENCAPVTLTWNPAQLPATGYFHLVDAVLGTMVNVNMRTTTSFTDVQDLRHLQIKYNYQICTNFNIGEGWNLLSLPMDVVNHNYLTLFPNASPGTLYGFSGTYYTTETIDNCTGYWLKFPASQFNQVCGLDRTQCVVNLTAGWNIIGGPNCNVPLNNVIDPGGIIISGSLYGYSGSYYSANSIDATKAYWIKTNASGTITIDCAATPPKRNKDLVVPPDAVTEFGKIEISDAELNSQTLYFKGKLDKNLTSENFSLPPVAPQGSFDARLKGDYRLSESDEVLIELQTSEFPVSVTISNINANEVYMLQELIDGKVFDSHSINDGSKIVISNEEVRILKITKQQALPTSYNLEQNYPNPFNPSTTIKFALPEATNTSLIIYNTLGQKITELVNTNLEAGYYNYKWDASNVATGIYIYELRTDKFVSVKKMILMK